MVSSLSNSTNPSNQATICTLSNRYPLTRDNQEQIIVFNILREMLNNDTRSSMSNQNDSDIEINYDSVIFDNNNNTNLSESVDDLPTYENVIKKQKNQNSR